MRKIPTAKYREFNESCENVHMDISEPPHVHTQAGHYDKYQQPYCGHNKAPVHWVISYAKVYRTKQTIVMTSHYYNAVLLNVLESFDVYRIDTHSTYNTIPFPNMALTPSAGKVTGPR